jgi:presenilin-like A22 family membrane protease
VVTGLHRHYALLAMPVVSNPVMMTFTVFVFFFFSFKEVLYILLKNKKKNLIHQVQILQMNTFFFLFLFSIFLSLLRLVKVISPNKKNIISRKRRDLVREANSQVYFYLFNM